MTPSPRRPATVRLTLHCGNRHRWDTPGTYNRASHETQPEQAHCPKPGCGRGWWLLHRHYGPHIAEVQVQVHA